MKNPKIVILDGHTMNPGDLSWTSIKRLGDVDIYPHTATNTLINRSYPAQILIVNKTLITAKIIEQLPKLKCICVTATGTNNIDKEAALRKRIPVYNVSGYSTNSVAQHVFSLIFALQNKIQQHNASVHNGDWTKNKDFCYTLSPISEITGKTLGIYGFGKIGQQVAKIGKAFGMKVISNHKHPLRDVKKGIRFVDWETLLKESDYLSLHAPLSSENQGIINATNLKMMKSSAVLINTGRGGLVNEKDLRKALLEEEIRAAALDVLSSEPPLKNNPMLGLDNCIITPHIAWASQEARKKLMKETALNIKKFLNSYC